MRRRKVRAVAALAGRVADLERRVAVLEQRRPQTVRVGGERKIQRRNRETAVKIED